MKNIFTSFIFLSLILITLSGCAQERADIALMPSQLKEPIDNRGNKATNTIFSDGITGTRIPYILVQFQYNLASMDVSYEVNGSGNVTQEDSEAVLNSGTTPFSQVHLESVDSIRYQPGSEEYAIFTLSFTNGAFPDVNQTAGLVNEDQDGYFFGYIGEEFNIGLLDNGETTLFNESTFYDKLDGTGKSGCNVDKSNLLIYRMSLGWLGIAPIKYEVFCGDQIGWVHFASIDLTNTQITPTNSNPVLPIHMDIVKGDTTANATMRTASWNGGIIDGGIQDEKRNPASRFFSHSSNKTISSGVTTNIITINSTEEFFGKTNRVRVELDFISASSFGNKEVTLLIRKNCQLDGTENWINEDPINSVISYDTNATTISGCTEIMNIQLSKEDSLRQILDRLDIRISAGETLTIAARSQNNNVVRVSLRWEELF